MTINEIINLIALNPKMLIAYYLIILAITIIAAIYVKRDNYKAPFTYVFTALIYGVSIPGIVSTILVIYGFFFQKLNFLHVNMLVYFLPIMALILIFVILNKAVGLKNIPGFRRISSLFIMITLALFIAYLLQKMFIGIIFFGKFQTLLIIFAIILVIIKLSWNRLVK